MEIDLTKKVTDEICGGCFADPDDDNACYSCPGYEMCKDIERVLESQINTLVKDWKRNLEP